jgi:hypothetical protein
MPAEIQWSIPKRVIYARYYGDMTMDAIVQSMEDAKPYFAEGIPMVHYIMDVTEVNSFPKLTELARGLKYEQQDNLGWSIYVGAEGIARFVISVTTQLAGSRFRLFDTLDEAMAFLTENDTSLVTES